MKFRIVKESHPKRETKYYVEKKKWYWLFWKTVVKRILYGTVRITFSDKKEAMEYIEKNFQPPTRTIVKEISY